MGCSTMAARALANICTLALSAFAAAAWGTEVTYKLTLLPPNSADFSWVGLVNDLGHGVVWEPGEYEEPTFYAFWSPKTGYMGIYLHQGDEYEIYPVAMNNLDQVVGLESYTEVAIWSPSGVVATFHAPSGYPSIQPRAINDDGSVVGYVQDAQGVPHSFHWVSGDYAVVDRPEQPSCAVGLNDKGDAVVQTLVEGAQYCDCPDAVATHLVHGHSGHPIRIPGHEPACFKGMDSDGDAAVYSGTVNGLWTLADGFTPIAHKNVQMIGIADRGIVAGSIYHRGSFLWKREGGLHWVKELMKPKDRDRGFEVKSISPKGVLGGASNGGWDAAILVPSRQDAPTE